MFMGVWWGSGGWQGGRPLKSTRRQGHLLKGHNICSIVVIWVNIFQTEKTIEIQPVRPTEVCGKV